jgi:hypothetical protein
MIFPHIVTASGLEHNSHWAAQRTSGGKEAIFNENHKGILFQDNRMRFYQEG